MAEGLMTFDMSLGKTSTRNRCLPVGCTVSAA